MFYYTVLQKLKTKNILYGKVKFWEYDGVTFKRQKKVIVILNLIVVHVFLCTSSDG